MQTGSLVLGDAIVDADAGSIRRGEREVMLEPRVMELLLELLARRGDVVSRDHLIDRVWGGYPGADHSLTNAVSKLRRALVELKLPAEWLETVPKRGYRLTGGDFAPSMGGTPSSPSAGSRPAVRRVGLGASMAAVVIAVVIVVGVAAVAAALWLRTEGSPPRIAIFPLIAGEGVDGQRAAGFTRDLASRLAESSGVELVFADYLSESVGSEDARLEAARRLKVDFFFAGEIRSISSVDTSGAHAVAGLRLNAALVRAADGRPAWAGLLDSASGSLAELRGELVAGLASALSIELPDAGPSGRPPTSSDEAYLLYLDALGQVRIGFLPYTGDQIEQAYFLLRRAVELDPSFAEAWAELATVLSVSPMLLEDADFTPMQALDRARSIAPDSADTLIASANVLLSASAPAMAGRNLDQALQAYTDALARRPNSVPALRGLSRALGEAGHHRLATLAAEAALRRAPQDPRVLGQAVTAHLAERNWARAEALAHRWATRAPQNEYPWLVAARVAMNRTGRPEAARALLDEAPRGLIRDASFAEIEGYGQNWFAIVERAQRRLDRGGPATLARSFSLAIFSIYAYRQLGDPATADRIADAVVAVLEPAQARFPNDLTVINSAKLVNLAAGRYPAALAAACQALDWSRDRGLPAWSALHGLAWVAVSSGREAEAAGFAEQLLDAHYAGIPAPMSATELRVGLIWAPLRDHSAYPALMQQAEAAESTDRPAPTPVEIGELIARVRDRGEPATPDLTVAERLCASG